MPVSWRSQVADGRVFELRSASKRYPPPCGLVLNAAAQYGEKFMTLVDRYGVVGHHLYARSHNPNIYVDGLRLTDFTSKRIARRRHDLERFDADDLALIRYGRALDFDGRIHGNYLQIPYVVPAEWTVFWIRAYDRDEFRYPDFRLHAQQRTLFGGAWHFDEHGGARHLGYKFGHLWATRHTGPRLAEIRHFLACQFPDVIEQPVRIVRWIGSDGSIHTEEIRRECPPLGSRYMSTRTRTGEVFGLLGTEATA